MTTNEHLLHFMQLIEGCDTIQRSLLARGRDAQHDFIIHNLYALVAEHPLISLSSLHRCYQILWKVPYVLGSVRVKLDEVVFTTRPLSLAA